MTNAMVGGLTIRLLGGAHVDVAGHPVQTDTRKATAVLAYLAVADRPQRRSTLAALLWPENDETRARSALRRTLSVLRHALGDRWLEVRGDVVAFDRTDATVDVAEFERALADGRLTDAVSLYAGDFLAGFEVRDSPAFDDWQSMHAEALRAKLARALVRLSAEAEADGDIAGAIAYARRHVELDRLNEPAHRELMRLYALRGDRAGAVRQYAECARVLDAELGVSPLPETRALHDAIREGRLSVAETTRSVTTAEAVGDVHTLHGDYLRAIESYETAIARAPSSSRAAIEHKLAGVYHRRGEWTKAERHYELANTASTDDAERARISADASLAAHRSGDPARADRLASEALRLAQRSEDRRALAQAHNILGILASRRGDTAGSLKHFDTSVRLAEDLHDPEAHVAGLNNLALAYKRAGDLERAQQLTQRALAECEPLGDRHRIAALHNNLADVYRALDRRDDAMRHLKRAVTLFAEIGESSVTQPEVWKLVEW